MCYYTRNPCLIQNAKQEQAKRKRKNSPHPQHPEIKSTEVLVWRLPEYSVHTCMYGGCDFDSRNSRCKKYHSALFF